MHVEISFSSFEASDLPAGCLALSPEPTRTSSLWWGFVRSCMGRRWFTWDGHIQMSEKTV